MQGAGVATHERTGVALCAQFVAKLFAKHLKLAAQLEELRALTPAVMVGTAHRAAQLLAATHKGALRASALRLVLVDA